MAAFIYICTYLTNMDVKQNESSEKMEPIGIYLFL